MQEHRALPWIALPFNVINALCFWYFAYGMGRQKAGAVSSGHWMVGIAGTLSVLGFLLLALFHDGAVHIMGAILFFNMHILMHYTLYSVLWM